MSNQIKILGIAPYEALNQSMNAVGEQFPNITLDVFTADLEEGKLLAMQLYQNGYDAIISRGGTAKLIKEVIDIPVFDVSISIYDILKSIHLTENYTDNFAIVGYASITEKAHLICDIMGYRIEILTITNDNEANQFLDDLASQSYELILCDVITNQLALSKSLNTILITSGVESIKLTLSEAINTVEYLKKIQHKKSLLEHSFNSQNQQVVIFDHQFNVHYTNISHSFEQFLIKYLRSKKTVNQSNQYFVTYQNLSFKIQIEQFTIDQSIFFSCFIYEQSIPQPNSKLGVKYQNHDTISEIFTTQLLFKQFISDTTSEDIKKAIPYYHSFLVFGESGTAKRNIAYHIYLNQELNTNYLITIDCKLMNDKLWRYLVNPDSGPLVHLNNTILFENIEQLNNTDLERLTSLIKEMNLIQTNQIIFTYNSKATNDTSKLQILSQTLDFANIYAPSIRERKSELSILATRILNKVNIECGREIIGFDPNALQTLISYDWPGNFNQLQSAIKELVINSNSHYISSQQVSDLINREEIINKVSMVQLSTFHSMNQSTQPTLFDYTREIILNVLEQNNGNQTKTAQQLNISRTTLWRYLKE
ncbi:sigma-54-dependent Fis family transcriptional regulator [Mammaliicoccus sp. Dog046]|uniref:sigma-54-dependent Fis family transcriptional regulator n=1 Tax=Mammaliicoccus sp. Dog046 TaxID=3034233 RepID=UPI002B25FD13|nr:PrpR N-terminal domain-containing protein [Mammaliicoccus sp. Dog046]WQK85760.1 PrpR N-terminal domain-containing protein [Mammaliicoccus sp. Dog046]